MVKEIGQIVGLNSTSPFLIRHPSVRLEMCMSDSSHCQLLSSLSLSSRAFLNMHALLFFFFSSTLQKSNGCPLLSPMFSSATRLYLWLTQFPGWIHAAVRETGAGERLADRQTDRQTQKHTRQRAYMPLRCPLECPPTPITRIASVSSYLSQARFLLLLFARDGCRSGWAHCTLHTSSSPTVLFTVYGWF